MTVLFATTSCANQGAPPGGPRDRTGPQVVQTSPDTFAVVAAFDDEIRIDFDERISERGSQGTLDGAVVISPESGEVRVRHSGNALRVTMAGGFQPDEVYRVTVQPVVQDLFRNTMPDAFEFIFSTGPEMTPNVLAGSVVDRITGEPVESAQMTARDERFGGAEEAEGPEAPEAPEGPVIPTHLATTDERGVYAFRYLPAGGYMITAFVDQNRDRRHNDLEPVGTGREALSPADTVFLDFSLLTPDTTSATVENVEVVDSVTLAVEFDDFLDPAFELTGVSALLGPDSLPGLEVLTVLHEREYPVRQDAIQDSIYVADSIQFEEDGRRIEELRNVGDSVAADDIESELETPRSPASADPRALLSRDLPKHVLFLLLSDTLVTDRSYELSLSGVSNINGVPGGGGTIEVLREPDQAESEDDLLQGDGADPTPDTDQTPSTDQPPDSVNPGPPLGLRR